MPQHSSFGASSRASSALLPRWAYRARPRATVPTGFDPDIVRIELPIQAQ
jgi:hypothetical protein